MKIHSEVYKQMLESPDIPPETGGVLGMKNNSSIIEKICFIENRFSDSSGVFLPDTYKANEIISNWMKNGIRFAGMFHSHALQWPELSRADKDYIVTIMQAMPSGVDELVFPIVFPRKGARGFLAQKYDNKVNIIEDDINIIF